MLRRSRNYFSTNNKRFKKRDVLVKRFKNPYFIKNRLPKRTKAPRLKMGIAFSCFLGIVGILLFHPYFLIRNFQISGNTTIPTEVIMGETDSIISKKRVFFLDGRNFFAINTQGIKQNLERKFVFQNLKIKTKFPQTLYVELEEREPSLLVSFVDSSSSASSSLKYYFLDKEGKIIREAAFNEGSGLIKVSIEKSDKPRVLGQQILLTANLPFLQFLKENLKIMGVDINQYLFSTGDDKVVNIQTGEGWKIVVDRQNDWKKQMQVLDTLLKNKIKDRKNLKYIDVRFENRSYYQ